MLIAGRGLYSWKGSGYVRGGIFDRIALIQGEETIRFRDRNHRRLRHIAAEGAPDFPEIALFTLPDDASSTRPSPGACSSWSSARTPAWTRPS